MALVSFSCDTKLSVTKLQRYREDGLGLESITDVSPQGATVNIPVSVTPYHYTIIDTIPGKYKITWQMLEGLSAGKVLSQDVNITKYCDVFMNVSQAIITPRNPTTSNVAIALTNLPYPFVLSPDAYNGGNARPYLDGNSVSVYTDIGEWHTWSSIKEGWHKVSVELKTYKSGRLAYAKTTPTVDVYLEFPPNPFSTYHSDTITVDLTTGACTVNRGYPPAEETIQNKYYYLAHPYALDFLTAEQRQKFMSSLSYPVTITYNGKNYTANNFNEELQINDFLGLMPIGAVPVIDYLKGLTLDQLYAWKQYWLATFANMQRGDMMGEVIHFYDNEINRRNQSQKTYDLKILNLLVSGRSELE